MIWSLPRTCYTGILHSAAQLESSYNIVIVIVICRSAKLASSALMSNSPLLIDVFSASQNLSFTSPGYNALFGCCHRKVYSDRGKHCAAFIRDVKLAPELNSHLLGEVVHMHNMCSFAILNHHSKLYLVMLLYQLLHLLWCVSCHQSLDMCI